MLLIILTYYYNNMIRCLIWQIFLYLYFSCERILNMSHYLIAYQYQTSMYHKRTGSLSCPFYSIWFYLVPLIGVHYRYIPDAIDMVASDPSNSSQLFAGLSSKFRVIRWGPWKVRRRVDLAPPPPPNIETRLFSQPVPIRGSDIFRSARERSLP